MQAFLDEILQILPLLGLRVLEPRVSAISHDKPATDTQFGLETENDTIIVPARKDGFEQTFLGANRWHAIRISAGMRPRLRWIAAYQTAPVQAITYLAEIDRIEPYGDGWKYAVVFKGPAQKLERPVPLADAPPGYMQGIRYTTHERLLRAQKVTDIGA